VTDPLGDRVNVPNSPAKADQPAADGSVTVLLRRIKVEE
jgi:hypothetical protein